MVFSVLCGATGRLVNADSGAAGGSAVERAASVLAPGANFNCFVDSGAAKCIGANDRGQLGDGTTTARVSPVSVTGLSTGVVSVAAGANHACALTSAGAVVCWGANDRGQLGNGTTVDSSTPVQVSGLSSGAVRIEAEAENSCVVTASGRALCWGNNQTYGTGTVTADTNSDGEFDPVRSPAEVTGLSSGVIAVGLGGFRTNATTSVSHGCAVLQFGQVKCWGSNSNGQVWSSAAGPFATPVEVSIGERAAAVALGSQHTCILTETGGVRCFGDNGTGQMGQGNVSASTNGQSYVPTGLSSGVAQVAVNRATSCVLTAAGGVTCWGDNIHGIIEPTATRSTVTAPTTVYALASGIDAIAMGEYQLCILRSGGTLFCSGANSWGQNGDGYGVRSLSPQVVRTSLSNGTALGGFQSLSSGTWTTCGLRTGGAVYCWGSNIYGNLGVSPPVSWGVPVLHGTLTSGVSAVAAGWHSHCAIVSGEVRCWGQNNNGQFGNGTTTSTLTTTTMLASQNPDVALTGVTQVAMGQMHGCVLVGGGVKCAGRNLNGSLGDGTTTARNLPVQVTGLTSGVTAVSVTTYSTSCALISDGTVKCWGSNNTGQVGAGVTGGMYYTPSTVTGVSNAVQIGSGEYFNCALISGGTVKCWGQNTNGQLGDGTNTNRSTPVTVQGITNAATLSVGARSVCVILTDATVKCWGWNFHGIFADGTTTDSTSPVAAQGISNVAELTQGATHICARLADATVKCWGSEQNGQLGNNRIWNRIYDGVTSLAVGLAPAPSLQPMPLLAPTTTTVAIPTTTVAASGQTPTTTTVAASGQTPTTTTTPAAAAGTSAPAASQVPVRIDRTTHFTAPQALGSGFLVNIVRSSDLSRLRIVSATPRTCVAAGRAVVAVSAGSCEVLVRSLRDGSVLRNWRTLVTVADQGVGSTVREAPLVRFDRESPLPRGWSMARLRRTIGMPRSVLVVGHTALYSGNSVENILLSRHRARNVASAVESWVPSVEASWTGLGATVPLSRTLNEIHQATNRRVVVYYVP
jgi:alpha-tubulin suppressor-like RCC1 family protein